MSDPRLVRCQYSQTPHPIDGECVNVTDAYTDDELETGLRRVLAALDPPPPVTARPEDGGHHRDRR